jgi:hypothetical protein
MPAAFTSPLGGALLRERLADQNLGKLNEQEESAIKQKMAAIDRLFQDQIKAKYKLEIQFHEARSNIKPFVGVMYFFLNGNRFNGGGDSKVYLCADDACHGVIDPTECIVVNLDEDPEQIKPAKMLCPKCKKLWPAMDLWGERLLKLTANDWARAILNNFRYMDSNADVSLIFHHADLHQHTLSEMDRIAQGDIIREVRRKREKAIYPLKNIIKDTSNGADPYSRFLAFMKET